MEYGFAFFPGQGAQAPGMGKDLYENSKAARLVFEEASDGAGIEVAKLCFESDKETLSRTENSQIAIFTHSMAALAALRENGVAFKAAAGFSLGEYTSLAAAGVVTLADGVKIVSKRGKLMQHAADTIDGGMAAILGLEDAKIEEACAAVKNGIVRPVNCPGQLVIAGEKAALAEAIENCKAAGARRALPLAVSGAFHTPLMAEAAAELRAFVSDFTFSAPTMDIYSNLDGQVYDCSNLPEHLEQHMISPVRWTRLVQNGMAAGLTSACEVGPGKTLTGFAGKISKELTAEWKNHLVEQHYAPTSINAMLSALNSLLGFLGLNDCRVKFLKVQRRLFRDADRELTKDDYQRLLNTAYQLGRDRLGLLVETIGATGIRVSDVKYVTVEAIRQGKAEISLKGKIRTILLPGKLRRKLLKYAQKQKIASGAIFRTRSGRELSRRQIWAELKGLCKHACVEPSKVFPHNLRHLFATVFYRVCRDIVKLADLLGHSSIETTRIYLVTSGSEHQRALDRLGLVS